MKSFWREIWIPILIIGGILVVYFGARNVGYVSDALAGWVIIACVMGLGLLIYFVRAALWGDMSWDRSMELAWGLAIAGLFVIGLPFGACMLISAILGKKDDPIGCFVVGVLGAVAIAIWFQWIEPRLSSRPKKVNAPCPKCKEFSLRLLKLSTGEKSPWGEPIHRSIYRCITCGWEGSFAEVWPEAVNRVLKK